MVNEAYLNRLNAGFTRSVFGRSGYRFAQRKRVKTKTGARSVLIESEPIGLQARSANGEVAQVDRLDPFRLGVNHQCADRERDAVGNSAVLGVQLEQPGLAGERVGQGPLPELEQQQRQRAAEQ